MQHPVCCWLLIANVSMLAMVSTSGMVYDCHVVYPRFEISKFLSFISSCLQRSCHARRCRQAALLTIGGLDLDPLLGRGGLDGVMNWEGDKQEMRRAAAALGYLASVVERLGFYLDIPLRYPIMLGNCKTVILSHAAAAGSYR